MSLLKEKELCFGCLRTGHMSRDCFKRLTCRSCGENHPRSLHLDKRDKPNTDTEPFKEPEAGNISAPHETCGHTGAGRDRCFLSISPLQVKSIKGDRIIQTYAFLDPGSTATFCSEHLMRRLNMVGRPTQFRLQTMGRERVVPTYECAELEVSGLETDIFYKLPEVLTQKRMPVSADNIATEEDIEKWPYLSKVRIPCIQAEVDLLIGSNAPKMLEPWEVINSQGDGPYAIRTALGWVINGPLHTYDSTMAPEVPSASWETYSQCFIRRRCSRTTEISYGFYGGQKEI